MPALHTTYSFQLCISNLCMNNSGFSWLHNFIRINICTTVVLIGWRRFFFQKIPIHFLTVFFCLFIFFFFNLFKLQYCKIDNTVAPVVSELSHWFGICAVNKNKPTIWTRLSNLYAFEHINPYEKLRCMYMYIWKILFTENYINRAVTPLLNYTLPYRIRPFCIHPWSSLLWIHCYRTELFPPEKYAEFEIPVLSFPSYLHSRTLFLSNLENQWIHWALQRNVKAPPFPVARLKSKLMRIKPPGGLFTQTLNVSINPIEFQHRYFMIS